MKAEKNRLKLYPSGLENKIIVGTDEVGLGALCGPVVCAAVILPDGFDNPLINDSKQLSEKKRNQAFEIIIKEALTYGVYSHNAKTIDKEGISKCTLLSMHGAISRMSIIPDHILVDGIKFIDYYDPTNFKRISHTTVIKGDSTYYQIAAASIIAKVIRDRYMTELSKSFPEYGWENNAGYGSLKHRNAIKEFGVTEYHRLTFLGNILPDNRLNV